MKVNLANVNTIEDIMLKDSVFSGAQKETLRSVFFRSVEDRTAEIIKENINLRTTIISDCWRDYNSLSKEGFKHLTVNHLVNFIDPESGLHTNTTESTWGALKKPLPKYGNVKPYMTVTSPNIVLGKSIFRIVRTNS